jgi:hypothetical protein
VKKYKFLSEAIVALEKKDFSTEEQIRNFEETTKKIKDDFLEEKLQKSCEKNLI